MICYQKNHWHFLVFQLLPWKWMFYSSIHLNNVYPFLISIFFLFHFSVFLIWVNLSWISYLIHFFQNNPPFFILLFRIFYNLLKFPYFLLLALSKQSSFLRGFILIYFLTFFNCILTSFILNFPFFSYMKVRLSMRTAKSTVYSFQNEVHSL